MGDWNHPLDDEFAEDQDPGPDVNVIVTFYVTIILWAVVTIAAAWIKWALEAQ